MLGAARKATRPAGPRPVDSDDPGWGAEEERRAGQPGVSKTSGRPCRPAPVPSGRAGRTGGCSESPDCEGFDRNPSPSCRLGAGHLAGAQAASPAARLGPGRGLLLIAPAIATAISTKGDLASVRAAGDAAAAAFGKPERAEPGGRGRSGRRPPRPPRARDSLAGWCSAATPDRLPVQAPSA